MPTKATYAKDKVIPLIKELLKKENIIIVDDNIKIWSCDYMNMTDVIIGCNHVKNELESHVACYTNKVNNIEHLENRTGVKIFDSERLKELALKHNEYELYDILN